MNSVMTAGLHHRWRARAADLARGRAGRPRAGRGDRHRRPGDRAGARAAARWSARTSRRGCSSARARRRRACRWEQADALALPYADDAFDAATVGFGARNFCDLERGPARDGPGRAAGRPRRGARDHDAARSRRCRRSSRSGSIASCRCSGRFDEAYTYLPELGQALPRARRRWRGAWSRRAAATCGWILTAGGIIALHHGTVRPDGERRGGRGGRRGGRGARPGADGRALEERLRRSRRSHGAVLGEHARRDDRRRRQAAAAAAGVRRRRAGARPSPTRRCARRWRSSWSTRPRSCTTTCSTPPALRRGRPTVVAAAGRAIATATGDLLFSRAFAELAAQRHAPSAVRVPVRRVVGAGRRASCCSARTPGTLDVDARALPAPLRAQDRAAVPGRVRARRAARAAATVDAAGRASARRIGLAFQLLDDVLDVSGPGRAHRQAPRHRPARRHGHAAADPRARARPGARARSTCARCARPSRPRRCATRSPRPARSRRPAREALAMVAEAKAELPALPERRSRRRWSWWPTASSTGTLASLEVFGQDRVGVRARRRSARSRPPCSPARGAAGRGPAPRCRGRAPRRSGRRWPGRTRRPRSTRSSGSAAATSQCVAEASSHSTG